jgi:hypothetical protein
MSTLMINLIARLILNKLRLFVSYSSGDFIEFPYKVRKGLQSVTKLSSCMHFEVSFCAHTRKR